MTLCKQCGAVLSGSLTFCPDCGARQKGEIKREQRPAEPEGDAPLAAALTQCRVCGKSVAITAKTCPHCGAKDPGVTWKAALFAGTVVMAIVTYLLFGNLLNSEKPAQRAATQEQRICKDGGLAYLKSRPHVKRNLKSPSSATFPIEEAKHQYLGDCRHRIVAAVDSQNSFGATIRTRYVATVRYQGKGKWGLEDLKFVK